MYRLYVKLKAVKAVLKEHNLACFGNLKQKVSQARDNLHLAKKEVLILLVGQIVYLRKKSVYMPMFLLLRLRNLS
jgi:hypothetical protein